MTSGTFGNTDCLLMLMQLDRYRLEVCTYDVVICAVPTHPLRVLLFCLTLTATGALTLTLTLTQFTTEQE